MKDNPFTPSFGTLPAVLVGRDGVLSEITPIFRTFRRSDIHWATHLCAHRGAGKTVLLDKIQDVASEAGWWIIQEDAGSGPPLVGRIIDQCLARLADRHPPRRGRSIKSVTVGPVGVEVGDRPQAASVTSLRDVLGAAVRSESNGVLVTIDEVHRASDSMLEEIGNVAQHLHRDGLPLVFVMAGLPRPDRAREATFLARAWHPDLGAIPDADIEAGLRRTAALGAGAWTATALRTAVRHSSGQPYLMQLVGYHAWAAARRSPITDAVVDGSLAVATAAFNRAVTSQMVASASPDQRRFLAAMARLGTPSRLAEVRAECGWSESQAGVYRHRLLASGLITPAGRGLIDFALPGVVDVLDDLEA